MNNKDFTNALAGASGLPQKTVQKLTAQLAAAMADLLDADTSLAVQGFGVFEVKKKMERIVVNPSPRQRKLVPPKLVLTFKASNVLKDKMQ